MQILRQPDVTKRTGLSQATLLRLEKANSFPSRIKLSDSTVGWLETEVEAWIEGRVAASRSDTVATGGSDSELP